MSLWVCRCEYCGNSTIPIGGTAVNVEFSTSKFCDCCYNSKQRKHSLFFCKPECLMSYMTERPEKYQEEVQTFKDDSYHQRSLANFNKETDGQATD